MRTNNKEPLQETDRLKPDLLANLKGQDLLTERIGEPWTLSPKDNY
jgi:hypothetical protein